MGDGLIGEASHLSRNLETLWEGHTQLSVRGVRGGWGAGGGGRENGSGQRVEHQGKLKGGNVLGCTHDQPGD